MWKVSGRSSALDRAQALLSAKRSSRGDGGGSTQDSPTKTRGGSLKTRRVPPNSHTLFSGLSDLSSESSASEQRAEAARPANTQENPERKGDSTEDLRPQSSLGERSRFLKKAAKPALSSHSPVSRNQAQPVAEPRYVASSQLGSQAPALRRLAEIENRVWSRKQELEQAKQASATVLSLTSDLEISPAATIQNMEATVELSAQSNGDQSQRENRFLKKQKAGAAERTSTAPPEATKRAAVGIRSKSKAGDPVAHSGGLERKPRRVISGISLESDEEDIKELLGDSVDSISIVEPERLSSMKRPHRTLSSPSEKIESPAAAHPPSPSTGAPPRSPASPSCRSSPFRFTGQAQVQFSPPRFPTSHSEWRGSSRKAESPQRSHSSSSGRAEVLSLEELFPVEPASEDPHSHMKFRINVMTLDELIPAGTASEMPGKQNQNKMADTVPESQSRHQQLPQEEKEVVADYHSDFDSDSSAMQISEHLGDDDGEEAEVRSELRPEVSGTDGSHKKTEDDYSSTFARVSECSHRSESFSRSRTSPTRSSRSSSQQSRRHASVRRSFKDAAVQTRPDPLADSWSAGMAPLDPTVGRIYMRPTHSVPPALSAERLEAICMFDPAVFALNEMLKQQLAMTKQFMERSEHLHSCLLRSLEPPNYRYTTLEETIQNICRHRRSKPPIEET
ncbi:uncharacterized protein C19orf44 homolog isoform 2-T2 [Anableps anableps]